MTSATANGGDSRAAFPIEATAVFPPPGMGLPNAFAFTQNDALVTYLYGEGMPAIQQLYAYDPARRAADVLVTPPDGGTREENLSPEEELQRQRQRVLAVGLTQYRLAEHSRRVLLPVQGSLYVQDGPGAPLRLVAQAGQGGPILTPAFAPDGERIAYVQDGEIYVVAASEGAPRQITVGARETGRTNGLAEFVVQEELARPEGFWWSRDGAHIAFTEVDETHIPVYRIVHQGKNITGPEAQEDHHYPFAGAANAKVRLGVVAADGGAPVWMDTDIGEERYIGRVFWWQDGSLGAVLLNRPQTALELVRFDRASGARTTELRETSAIWINLPKKPITLLESGGFIWLSERSGYCHAYSYDASGALVRALTSGEWVVDEVAGVDECARIVYLVGNREHPTAAALFAVGLDADGPAPRCVTPEPGTHAVTLDHARQRFVDVHSALDTPPHVTLRALADGAVLGTLFTPNDPRLTEYTLTPPQLVSLRSRDGVELHGALYSPPAHFGTGPHPTIIAVYGGPGVQTVTDAWWLTVDMDVQYLCDRGYLVFKVDGRGSARRGLAFESPLKHSMGTQEVRDQVDGVQWLVQRGLADPARVGVMGWSYGGYMTLMCLTTAPDIFKMGVAGAPVTHFDGYDTAYTERYMGTPQENPAGYAEGSVMRHVEHLRGRLLLIHGMSDENVHFRHTARLINALIRARKPYDALLFPDERHMPRHEDARLYLNERVVQYFRDTL